MNLWHPVKIGSYTTRGNIFLAPVAGYSDSAFRSICTELACDLAFTEMVSSEALTRNNVKTEILLKREQNEKDFAVQIFGSNPETMANAAVIVAKRYQPVIIDINSGCPVPKILKSGAGSELMRNGKKTGEIIKAIKKELYENNIDIPVTIKIRLGWDESSKNYLEIAKIAEEAGISAITLHARTKTQGYSGYADRNAFFELAKAVSIPVFASGDITPQSAKEILSGNDKYSKPVEGVMFARNAMGNPFVFLQTKAILEGLTEPEISNRQRFEIAKKHYFLSINCYGETVASVEFRKQACSYLKGIPGGAELRRLVVTCESIEDYNKFFNHWEELL